MNLKRQRKSWIRYAIISVILLVLLWLVGPMLHFSGHRPLASLALRYQLSLVLIILWILYPLWHRLKQWVKMSRTTTSIDAELARDMRAQLQACLKLMRRQHRFTWLYQYTQPWNLIVGSKNSGKTALLNNSGIQLQPVNAKQGEWKSPVQYWHSKQHGFYIECGDIDDGAWRYLLKLLKHYRAHKPLDRAIVVVDALQLCHLHEGHRDATQQLAERVKSLKNFGSTLAVNLVVSKLDIMPGFVDFFADLSPEDREQAWGISLTDRQAGTSIEQHVQKQLHRLLQHMSQLMFTRLHRERSQSKRNQLKEFPVYFERLTPFLQKFIQQINWGVSFNLDCAYFCSSVQPYEHSGKVIEPFSQAELPPLDPSQYNQHNKCYFIPGLFQIWQYNSITEDSDANHITISRRLIAYPSAIIIIAITALVWHRVYQDNVLAIQDARFGLNILKTSSPKTKQYWLVKLDALHKTLASLHENTNPGQHWLGLNRANVIQHKAEQAYISILKQSFNPYLQQIISHTLKQSVQTHGQNLYANLQTYLMLTDPKRLNNTLVEQWFAAYWANETNISTEQQTELLQHLHKSLQQHLVSFQADPLLIERAREAILSLSAAQISDMILRAHYQVPAQPLLSMAHNIPGLDLSQASIPAMYSIENFNTVYNKLIQQVVTQLGKGNWVLGLQHSSTANADLRSKSLFAEVRILYLQHYAQAWQQVLAKVNMAHANNLAELQQSMRLITNPKSRLWELVKIIVTNASILQTNATENPYTDLHHWLNTPSEQQNLGIALENLLDYSTNISKAGNPDNAAYNAAVKAAIHYGTKNDVFSQLQQLSTTLPQPLQTWVQQINHRAWNLILQRAAAYVSKLWVSTVLPEYQQNISKRFPIFKDATQGISLNNFSAFFGPSGTMATFFSYYLKPFVDTSHFYWTWKKVHGSALPVSQKTLEAFLRASLIQKMFFANNSTKPSFQFSLTPTSLSPNDVQFTLNLEGQTLAVNSQSSSTYDINWPGQHPGFISYRFDTVQNQHPTVTVTGPWAWLRLLVGANLQAAHSAHTFRISIDNTGNKVGFEISTDELVSPFVPNVLDGFRAPKDILSK